MKKIVYLFLAVVISLMFNSCGKKGETKNENNNKKLPLVKVREIQGEQFSEVFRVIGIVKPYQTAKVSSEEGGLISYIRKDKGDRVGKGEVLVRLLKDQDEAAYLQSQSQYELAKDNFERIEKLYKENATTEQLYTNARLQLDIAEKSVNLLKVRLRKGFITSPINGVIDAKYMNRGEMTVPGSPIYSIVDISRVKITAGVPEKHLTEISKGQNVKINFDVLENEEFEGKISYISPTLNMVNRTFEIEIIMDNKQRKFKPEMSAYITITKLDLENAVVLEQDLIVDNVDEQFVFVLDNDIAHKRVIKLGGRNDNKVLIESGLNVGDKLIYVGFQNLVDGDKVQIVN